jgi:hypothetical protein
MIKLHLDYYIHKAASILQIGKKRANLPLMIAVRRFAFTISLSIERHSAVSVASIKVKRPNVGVVCKDYTLEHGEPGIKVTLIFGIIDNGHCNHVYISARQLVQLNKLLSHIPYIYSSILL